MNPNQLGELFDTSKQNIGQHIGSILEDKELDANSVVKNYFTTANDGKNYKVTFHPLLLVKSGCCTNEKRIQVIEKRISEIKSNNPLLQG